MQPSPSPPSSLPPLLPHPPHTITVSPIRPVHHRHHCHPAPHVHHFVAHFPPTRCVPHNLSVPPSSPLSSPRPPPPQSAPLIPLGLPNQHHYSPTRFSLFSPFPSRFLARTKLAHVLLSAPVRYSPPVFTPRSLTSLVRMQICKYITSQYVCTPPLCMHATSAVCTPPICTYACTSPVMYVCTPTRPPVLYAHVCKPPPLIHCPVCDTLSSPAPP